MPRAFYINFDAFINPVTIFVVIAFAVFLLIKGIKSLRRKGIAPPAELTTKE